MPTLPSKIYSDYIGEQLAREEQRKNSLQAGGFAVVTTSGALATLLLGLAALSKKNQDSKGTFVLPESSHVWLRWALVFFALAALGAILTNFPVWLQYVNPADLKKVLQDSSKSECDAQIDVGENQIAILESLQRWNGRKGWVLFVAMIFEVVAIALIAVAVWKAL